MSDGQCTVRGSRQSGGCRRAAAASAPLPILACPNPPSCIHIHSLPLPSPLFFPPVPLFPRNEASILDPFLPPSSPEIFPLLSLSRKPVHTLFFLESERIGKTIYSKYRLSVETERKKNGKRRKQGWLKKGAAQLHAPPPLFPSRDDDVDRCPRKKKKHSAEGYAHRGGKECVELEERGKKRKPSSSPPSPRYGRRFFSLG